MSGEKIPEPIAFGCDLFPADVDARLVWTGTICGYSAGRTARGCYHAELVATRLSPAGTALHELRAEICLPTLHHMESYLAMFLELVDDDPDNPDNKRTKTALVRALPELHAIAQGKRAADARRRILG